MVRGSLSDVTNGPSAALRKVRRGTRSCWECKRRKIRCRYNSNDGSTCDWCLSHGSTCVSQLYPETETDQSGSRSLQARMTRIECLLEDLVEKTGHDNAATFRNNTQSITSGEDDLGTDVLDGTATVNSRATESHVLSLFDNAMFQYKSPTKMHITRHEFPSHDSLTTSPICDEPTTSSSKLDRVSAQLLSMIPSEDVVAALKVASTPWISQLLEALPSFRSRANFSLLDALAPCSLASHPTVVARGLMCIVMCLQQLPIGHDITRFNPGTKSKDLIDYITSSVSSLVISDDELIATPEGLECLMLQNVFYINSGKPRRAWLSVRRAVAISQLIGLHQNGAETAQREHRKEEEISSSMWHHICHSERFLALILGLPYGIHYEHCYRHELCGDGREPSVDVDYLRQLDAIAGRIIDRDQTSSKKDFLTAHKIQDELERLAASMPEAWWTVPDVVHVSCQEVTSISYRRLNTQIWHYQLEMTLHLPFMFNAASSVKFDYSQFCCLRAARKLIQRHALVRESSEMFSCCLTNFQAFMATLVLVINLLKPNKSFGREQTEVQKQAEWTTIEQVIQRLDAVNTRFGDSVALQAANVLKALRAVEFGPQVEIEDVQLSIPYFGTISIRRRTEPNNIPMNTTGVQQELPFFPGYQTDMEDPPRREWADYLSIYLSTDDLMQSSPGSADLLQSWSIGATDLFQPEQANSPFFPSV